MKQGTNLNLIDANEHFYTDFKRCCWIKQQIIFLQGI